MKEKLEKLLENSYAKYSNFRVSSIIIMKDGKEFSGVNVENASYGATICAERSAIVSAISAGYKQYDFESMFVMVDSEKISSSCFLCRQMMSEFFEKNKKVTFMNKLGDTKVVTIQELCPFPFDEGDLK